MMQFLVPKLWQRTLIKVHLKSLIWILLGFFALYSLIDISFHPWLFNHVKESNFLIIPLFSLIQFIRKLHLFLPFAYLLSVVMTLLRAQNQKELMVLLTSGLSKLKILTPFLAVAVFVSIFTFINTQFFMPLATNRLILMKYPKIHAYLNKQSIKQFEFEDGSFFIFQSFDPVEKRYEDVYFKKEDLLIHANYVKKEEGFVGYFVDFFKKQDQKLKSFASFKSFPIKNLNLSYLDEKLIQKDPHEHSLTTLHKMQKMPLFIPNLKSKLSAAYHFKWIFLFLSFLLLVAIFPFLTHFSKNLNPFKFYALYTFGFVLFYLFMKGAIVLTEGGLVSAFYSLWVPFLTLMGLFSVLFVKKIRH